MEPAQSEPTRSAYTSTYGNADVYVPRERDHAVLLWDADNVWAAKRDLHRLLHALIAEAAFPTYRIAAAQRRMYRANRDFLTVNGFEVRSGGTRASGADKELLFRARQLAKVGVSLFVVASNDGRFAALARIGEVHVISTDVSQVSRRLARVAMRVEQVVCVGDSANTKDID